MSQVSFSLSPSRRFALLFAMVALLAVGIVTSQPQTAYAATLRPIFCTYYHDAAHTQFAGWFSFNCNGTTASGSGIKTTFKVCESDWCCGSMWC